MEFEEKELAKFEKIKNYQLKWKKEEQYLQDVTKKYFKKATPPDDSFE